MATPEVQLSPTTALTPCAHAGKGLCRLLHFQRRKRGCVHGWSQFTSLLTSLQGRKIHPTSPSPVRFCFSSFFFISSHQQHLVSMDSVQCQLCSPWLPLQALLRFYRTFPKPGRVSPLSSSKGHSCQSQGPSFASPSNCTRPQWGPAQGRRSRGQS